MLLADDLPLLPPRDEKPAAFDPLPMVQLGSGDTVADISLGVSQTVPDRGDGSALLGMRDGADVAGTEAEDPGEVSLELTFEQAGSLGIEFERLSAPYVVEMIHANGLAYGQGLLSGDRLVKVGDQAVDALEWEELVKHLTCRPVSATFLRTPRAQKVESGGALLSGFTSRMRLLGGSVAQQGFDLGNKVGSVGIDLGSKVGSVGLDLGNKVGSVGIGLGSKVGNVGLDLGNKVGSVGFDLGSKVGGVGLDLGGKVGSVTSSLYSGLLESVQDPSAEEDAAHAVGLNRQTEEAAPPSAELPPASAGDDVDAPAGDASPAPQSTPSSPGPELAASSVAPAEPVEDAAPAPCAATRQSVRLADVLPAAVSEASANAAGLGEGPVQNGPASMPQASGRAVALDEDRDHPVAATETEPILEEVKPSSDDPIGLIARDEGDAAVEETSATAEAGSADMAKAANGLLDLALDEMIAAGGTPDTEKLSHDGIDLSVPTHMDDTIGQHGSGNQDGGGEADPALAGEQPRGPKDLHGAPATLEVDRTRAEGSTGGEVQRAARDPRASPGLGSGGVDRPDVELQRSRDGRAEASEAAGPAESRVRRLTEDLRDRDERLLRLEAELDAARASCESLGREAEDREASSAQLQEAARSSLAAASERERLASERCRALEAQAREQADAREHQARAREQELEAQLAQLRGELEERRRACAACEEGLQAELLAAKAAVDEARASQQREAAAAQGQLEQLRFALRERERGLEEKAQTLSQRDEEVKSLLRQLAAVGDGCPPVQEPAAVEDPSGAVTVFEVMFALEGALGLEFQRLAAPYIVSQVHADKVATGLGIVPGDELIAVAEESVEDAPWEVLVQRLSGRPVVARFRRDPGRPEEGGFISSVSSVGTTLLSRARGAVPRPSGAGAEPQDARLQAEAERLATLLRARDAEVLELGKRLEQREGAVRLLEAGGAGAAEASRLVQEREALAQRARELEEGLGRAGRQAQELQAERDRLGERCAEEARQKEEQQQRAGALAERCSSLMAQFESLRETCQSLSLDSQQKAGLEGQVQELTRMNAQWQQLHQNQTSEFEGLRQRTQELQQLEAEVLQLRQCKEACGRLERQLREAEERLEASSADSARCQDERRSEHATIQRLQALLESMEERGESQAGQLEAELLAQRRESAALHRQTEEQQLRIEELLRGRRECREAAEEGRALKTESERLKQDLATAQLEHTKLNGVVEQCIAKLQKESQERPHLVDKRMVTQMLAAYLEQRENPRQQQEIMSKMADLLGFTAAEREQVGLAQRRRTLLEQQDEAAGLADLTDRFVDFLFEESEGA